MRISDWSSDVCSSDLRAFSAAKESWTLAGQLTPSASIPPVRHRSRTSRWHFRPQRPVTAMVGAAAAACLAVVSAPTLLLMWQSRSEEHTSELQSLMRISYAVFCLKKKKTQQQQ